MPTHPSYKWTERYPTVTIDWQWERYSFPLTKKNILKHWKKRCQKHCTRDDIPWPRLMAEIKKDIRNCKRVLNAKQQTERLSFSWDISYCLSIYLERPQRVYAIRQHMLKALTAYTIQWNGAHSSPSSLVFLTKKKNKSFFFLSPFRLAWYCVNWIHACKQNAFNDIFHYWNRCWSLP